MSEGGYTWGLDIGLRHVAFAFVKPGEQPVLREMRIGSAKQGAPMFALLYRSVFDYVVDAAAYYPPAKVVLEQPTGRHPNPALTAAWGIVGAAVHVALGERVPVLSMPISTWKKQTVGHGHAKKKDVVAWATTFLGVAPNTEDMADALGVAIAASGIPAGGLFR